MKTKHCDIGNHECEVLFHARTKDRPSACAIHAPRTPIKKPQVGDTFKETKVSHEEWTGTPYHKEFRVTNISPSKPTYVKVVPKGKTVKKKAIAPISDAQKKRLAEYRIVRDKYMKENPICQARLPIICTNYASEIHHKGGKIGSMLTNVKYFLAVCRACHNWIGNNHASAMNLGLVVERLNK